jgi:hypothetical protein
VFTFGDAPFLGSEGGVALNSPIVGMAATPDGKGYWIVAGDGGVFTFGDARYLGSEGDQAIAASVAGMAVTPDGKGYWLVGSGGAVYWFGDAQPHGSSVATFPTEPIAAIVGTHSGQGYWLLEPDAFPTDFHHPGTGSPIVAAAGGQIMGDGDPGSFCNPYGPCEEWCALFATWVWEAAGVPIPRYAFTGDIFNWAATNTAVTGGATGGQPGEIVLYGTGPASTSTSVHAGVVVQRWPDGAIVTVEGDAGPGPPGHYNVVMNGPYLPADSLDYNGVGIYAFAIP